MSSQRKQPSYLDSDQEKNDSCSTTTPSGGAKIGCIHFKRALTLYLAKLCLYERLRTRLCQGLKDNIKASDPHSNNTPYGSLLISKISSVATQPFNDK